MPSGNFTIELDLEAPARVVYDAAATRDGIAGWWTRKTDFDDREGSIAEMRFPDAGFFARMLVEKLQPSNLVHWKCLEAEHPPGVSSDPRDWIGTEIVFEIEETGKNASRLRFTHVGLAPLECFETCSNIWDFYIRRSFRQLVESGQGQPAS